MTGEAVLGRKVDDKYEVSIPDKQTERGYHTHWGSQQREGPHIPPPTCSSSGVPYLKMTTHQLLTCPERKLAGVTSDTS